MTMKGFPAQEKLGPQQYATLSPAGNGKTAVDMLPKAIYSVNGTNTLVPTNALFGKYKTGEELKKQHQIIQIPNHGAKIGDVLRFTVGALTGSESAVIEVIDENILELGNRLDETISAVTSELILQDITYTAVTAGIASNYIQMEYVAGGTAGSETIAVSGTGIVSDPYIIQVTIDDTVSTAAQIATAVNGDVTSNVLISAVDTTPAATQTIVAPTSLTGGFEPAECLLMRHITLTLNAEGQLSVSSGPLEYIDDGTDTKVEIDSVTPANNKALPVDNYITVDSVQTSISVDTAVPANTVAMPSQLHFERDGVIQKVIKDTVTPANTRPIPMELVSTSGVEATFNVTTGDLNVQTSHTGIAPDSMQIGDGTNLMGVNASLEALVHDADALVELQAILAKIIAAPATEAKQDTTITQLTALLTELQLKADLTETQPVSMASAMPLPTGAATEVTLAALLAKVIAAPATEAKQDAEITELQAILAKIIAAPATEAKQDAVITALGLVSTEATLALQSAKLPSVIGQNLSADSLSVVVASDAGPIDVASAPIDNLAFNFLQTSVTNITDSAYTELIADTGLVEGKKIKLVCEFGAPLLIGFGAAAAEVPRGICQKGGFADGPLEIVVPANTRISVKAAESGVTVSSGNVYINVMG